MEKVKKDPDFRFLRPPDFEFNTLRFRQIGQPRHRYSSIRRRETAPARIQKPHSASLLAGGMLADS